MGGHSQCWGGMLELLQASLAPSILLLPPPRCPLPGTKSPLYSQHQRLSHSITPPRSQGRVTLPFYSQGRVTLAATSQAWEEPTRSSRKPQPALCHIQGVDPWNCSFCTSGLVWGFNRWRENFQARRLCPHQLLSTQTWSDVEEVSQVLLRGGSRLGRAASHRARRGGGTCSRWPR